MDVRNLQKQRRKEVQSLLTVLFGGAAKKVHVKWVDLIDGHGFKLISVGPGSDNTLDADFIPLIPGALSVTFEEMWTQPRNADPILASTRLVVHDTRQDLKDVLVLEAEPSFSGEEAPTPYKRGWHIHLKELPVPWRKLHFGMFPRTPVERIECSDTHERKNLNAEMKRALHMLFVELVGRKWPDWNR